MVFATTRALIDQTYNVKQNISYAELAGKKLGKTIFAPANQMAAFQPRPIAMAIGRSAGQSSEVGELRVSAKATSRK